jgi:glyoxylase-like metal-dependent hydrolase (beta-lactamase superfamily II)
LPEGDNEDLRWVTNSATLIFGDHEAVLVDTFTTVAQNEELIKWVKDHNRRLTHVYLTHGHGDHVYGIGQLVEAFPTARAIGTSGTVAESRLQAREEYRDGFWGRLFPGQIPVPVLPEVFEDDHFMLEGHELQIVQTGHTDTEGTTILWVPDIRLVVAGHKYPGRTDDPATVDDSIQYLTDFIEAERTTMTALELYEAVLRRHPRRANPGSLWGAAKKIKGSPITLPRK